jgi:ferric-dicitrate binding protein FerR (iron transport regulator)
MTEDRAESALRQLVRDARQDPTPELEWDAIEASLLARRARAERMPAPRRLSWLAPAALAALAALGAAAGLLLKPALPPSTEAPQEAAVASTSTAPLGNLVTAESQPIVVTHLDHVTWTLAPDGVARVESVGDVIALGLERGTLSARVTKSKRPESFVVRVEKTRIAVHGTAFRVERLEKAVHVEVEEGVVAVGPVGGTAFEVRAPGSVVVSFDGVRADARRAVGAAAPAQGGLSAGSATEAIAANPAENEPETATPPVEAAPSEPPGVERVIQAVRHCLSENTVARGDLRVTVRTRMSLRVEATGKVGEVLFAPPLAPPVQHCVDAKVGSIGFFASKDGFALDRAIELER